MGRSARFLFAGALGAFVAWSALVAGCTSSPGGGKAETPGPAGPRPHDPVFAADSAWSFLSAQVAFGPRVPGSPAHAACATWMAESLRGWGVPVVRDSFSVTDPEGRRWALLNLQGRLGPEGPGRILYVAHWDSRPWADQDPDPARRSQPILGANDGASGVAVLLELARGLAHARLPRGVDVLFVDGEDLGRAGDPSGYCQGSRRFVTRDVSMYWRVVVVDMVGDLDLVIPIEGNSERRAPEAVDWVFARGTQLSPHVFVPRPGLTITDDHVPFLEAGIPAVDLIDFDFPAWHTHFDDLSVVDRASLEAVGRVLLSLALRP